jgi:hypothetical protein
MCKYAPGAISKNGQYIGVSELTLESGKRPGFWKPYRDTCWSCPISDLCNWNMPHNYHYNRSSRQGGLLFIPRPRMEGETPLQLDYLAKPVAHCSRHQGNYWSTDQGGCIGCGECRHEIDLPVRLQKERDSTKTK